MNINIKTSTITLTPSISEYVAKRFQVTEKFLANDTTTRFALELAKTTNHHKHGEIFKAEAHIVAKGENIYASAEEEDLYSAIDKVRDEIMRKIKSQKDKKQSLLRRGGAQVKNIIKGFWK